MSGEEPRVDEAKVEALRDWLVDGGRLADRASEVVAAICERLCAAGVPLARMRLFILTLHPNIRGRSFAWQPDEGVTVSEADRVTEQTSAFRDSIVLNVMTTGARYRCRFVHGERLPGFPVADQFAAEGMTDYLIVPLVYTNGETHAVSWTTRAPAGFDDRHVAALERIRGPLARLTEIFMLRLNAASLLSAYVGRAGGRRVLDGNVRRGDTELIEAAILFVDVKDFTRMSNSLPAEDVIGTLNGFFEVIVAAVEAGNGEVLKFIGDGLLAIFPVGGGASGAAVQTALAALHQAQATFASAGQGATGFRAAIHVGPVSYGNIGGGDRLDFTAIGPAVNLAARLLAAAASTGSDFVASGEAARHLEGCRPLGRFAPKGWSGEQPIFALPVAGSPRDGSPAD